MPPARSRPCDPWLLIRRQSNPAAFAQDESLFALSNGSLGVRGGLEEDDSPSQGCFLAGAWERAPIEYHERFPGFAAHTDTRVPVTDGTRRECVCDSVDSRSRPAFVSSGLLRNPS